MSAPTGHPCGGREADPSVAGPGAGRSLLICAWCLLPAIAAAALRGLWAPDEPRYAEVAREIVRSGDWLLLHLAGEAYPDKPPLLFWLLAGLGAGQPGRPDVVLRLPSLVATALTAWLTARLAIAHGHAGIARTAPWLLLTMVLPLYLAGRLQIDPLLTLGTTAAIVLLTTPSPTHRTARLLGAGLATGLAALTKGPVAWLVVGLVVLSAPRTSTATGRSRTVTITRAAALLLAVLPIALWAWAVIRRAPQLTDELLWGEHAARLVSARSHPGPSWEPLVEFLLLALPWTPLVVLGARRAWRRDAPRLQRLALRWLLVLLVAFSLSAEKRNLYLLPAYPAAALLAAGALQTVADHRALRWALALPSLCIALAGVAALGFQGRLAELAPGAIALAPRLLVIAALAAATAWLVLRARALPRAAVRLATGHAATALAIAILGLPLVDPHKSARQFAGEVARHLAADPPDTLPCVGVRPAGFRYYADLPAVADPDGSRTARQFDADGAAAAALVSTEHLLRLSPAALRRARLLAARPIGSRHVLLLGR